MVGRAVVQAAALYVHQRDHVGRVLGDDLEEFFTLGRAARAQIDPQLLDEQNQQQRNQESPSGRSHGGRSESREAGIE